MLGTSDLNEMLGELETTCNGYVFGPDKFCNQPLEDGSTLCKNHGEIEDWTLFSDLWKDDYGFRPRSGCGVETIEQVREWMDERRKADSAFAGFLQ